MAGAESGIGQDPGMIGEFPLRRVLTATCISKARE